MKQIVCFTILILFTSTSCQKDYSTSEDEQAITKLIETWDKNGLSGNRAENAEFFTNDGVRVEGGKIYSGKESIRKLFSSQQEHRTYLKLENKIERIWSSEDFITVTGIRTVSFINSVTGDTITNKSITVTVFERQADGSLKSAYNHKDDIIE
jgi:ketosteroid isomerase-like protein